jgi:hypothetical protein
VIIIIQEISDNIYEVVFLNVYSHIREYAGAPHLQKRDKNIYPET